MRYLLVFLLFAALTGKAQNGVLGIYSGTLYQPTGGYSTEYSISFEIDSVSGSNFFGHSFLCMPDTSMYAYFTITGNKTANSMLIQDAKIVNEKVVNGRWCIKTMNLEKTDETNWKGNWSAPDCKGGTIELKSTTIVNKENREVVVKEAVAITKRNIIIEVWDNNREDGDIISLKINNTWILKNYTVTKEKKRLKVKMPVKESTIVLIAENLGATRPNTAAISIIDGDQIKTVVLRSDMGKSEAIRIMINE